jgi:hypothetical protein
MQRPVFTGLGFALTIALMALGCSFGEGDGGESPGEINFAPEMMPENQGAGGAGGAMGMDPGGNDPGGNDPGGNDPGGNDPGGNDPGGNDPGGNDPGGNDPGGNDPGGNDPGGNDPGGNAGPGSLGAACTSDNDCDGGVCVTGLPGGYCSNFCEADTVLEDCGANGSCWNLGQPQMVCLLNCVGDDECRTGEGYICDGDDTCFPSNPGGGGGAPPGENPDICDNEPLACVGETVSDFSLTNCGTGQPVSMQQYFAGQRAGMYVLTAGWCPACADWIPQMVGLEANPMAAGLKIAYVLGEDSNRRQPSQAYCQQYAQRHNVPVERMFMDHDGMNSFRTMFTYMWPYIGADGSFGLPFNAVVDPSTWEYIYADRGPGGDLNAAFGRLLQ